MFTGIIQEIGTIKSIQNSQNEKIFEVSCTESIKNKKIGQSIAVNGVCVTITELTNNSFSFEAMPETLEISNFGALKKNSQVNLEPAMKLGDSLDGHLVQGHVDGIGEVVSPIDTNSQKAILTINYPQKIQKYLAFKGSITINGISLTISKLDQETLSVDLIPHTLEKTNLGNLKKGDKVNLEADMLAKHIENLLDSREKQAKYEYLKERGFI